MKKKYASFDYNSEYVPTDDYNLKEDEYYKKVVHKISQLYKIKDINRSIKYDDAKLRELVLKSDIGKQTIADLEELGVNREILEYYGLHFFNRILGNQFDDSLT